jgi:hypothetical protein
VADKDLQYGVATIHRILRKLEQPESLAHPFAEAVLRQAVRNASGKPTPQARMAAANMDVRGDTIGPSAGGAPAEVAIGSEFGSAIYPQFHAPPTKRGYWLYPAGEAVQVIAEGDRTLEDILKRAAAGYG